MAPKSLSLAPVWAERFRFKSPCCHVLPNVLGLFNRMELLPYKPPHPVIQHAPSSPTASGALFNIICIIIGCAPPSLRNWNPWGTAASLACCWCLLNECMFKHDLLDSCPQANCHSTWGAPVTRQYLFWDLQITFSCKESGSPQEASNRKGTTTVISVSREPVPQRGRSHAKGSWRKRSQVLPSFIPLIMIVNEEIIS